MTTSKTIYPAQPDKQTAQADCCLEEESECEEIQPPINREKEPPTYYHREIF